MATTLEVQNKIIAAAQKYGVDPTLALAVGWQESRFQPAAKSGAGAIGVMQLMPATAKGLGVDPYSLDGNIEGGVKYLAQMAARYGGDQTKMLWAYNAGPGAVDAGRLPAETAAYIPSVMAQREYYGGASSPFALNSEDGGSLPGGGATASIPSSDWLAWASQAASDLSQPLNAQFPAAALAAAGAGLVYLLLG